MSAAVFFIFFSRNCTRRLIRKVYLEDFSRIPVCHIHPLKEAFPREKCRMCPLINPDTSWGSYSAIRRLTALRSFGFPAWIFYRVSTAGARAGTLPRCAWASTYCLICPHSSRRLIHARLRPLVTKHHDISGLINFPHVTFSIHTIWLSYHGFKFFNGDFHVINPDSEVGAGSAGHQPGYLARKIIGLP